MSNREKFLGLINRPLRTKQVAIGSETFTLRELSEAQAADMEVAMQKKDGVDWSAHRRLMVAYCLIDENNERIISDPNELKHAPKSIIAPLYAACLELSDYDESEIDKLAKKSNEADAEK